MRKTQINFFVNGDPSSFEVMHNFPEERGISIEAVAREWYLKTKVFTVDNFCAFANSTMTGYTCEPVRK